MTEEFVDSKWCKDCTMDPSWSPQTSLRYGFSTLDDNGNIVSVWNFGDWGETLREIYSDEESLDKGCVAVKEGVVDAVEDVKSSEVEAEPVSTGVDRSGDDCFGPTCVLSTGSLVGGDGFLDLPDLETTGGDRGMAALEHGGLICDMPELDQGFLSLSDCLAHAATHFCEEGGSVIPTEELRHLPLTPRLLDMLSEPLHASFMTWYAHHATEMGNTGHDGYEDMPDLETDAVTCGIPALERRAQDCNMSECRNGLLCVKTSDMVHLVPQVYPFDVQDLSRQLLMLYIICAHLHVPNITSYFLVGILLQTYMM